MRDLRWLSLLDAKADAQTCCVDKASQPENVALLTNARVERLVPTPSGRQIQTVEASGDRVEQPFRAEIVVVAHTQ